MPEFPLRRAFFALWPTPEVAAALYALGADLKGRITRVEDIHLTLAFIGDVDAARFETLLSIASGLSLPRSELVIDRLGHWRHNRILWAAPAKFPPELSDFVAGLHTTLRAAGFDLEARDFVPHITLLRNAAGISGAPAVEPLIWPVTEWHLAVALRSETGSRYRRMANWSAKGADQFA